MAEAKKYAYKYCIVPLCRSTTIKTPDKSFFRVPFDKSKREKWCKLMGRDLIGPKSTKYVCEDHFDVENDIENLIKYRLVGEALKLKANVYPHKFDCRKAIKPKKGQRPCKKRRRTEGYENSSTEESSTSSQPTSFQTFETIECGETELHDTEKPQPGDTNKQVQVNIRLLRRNKAVQTSTKRTKGKNSKIECTKMVHTSTQSTK